MKKSATVSLLVPALILMGLAAVPAADLRDVVRTLSKKPAYQSKPKYCLLVFGPEAKCRVWLVLDGDVLYVDRNGNGNLTEKGKRMLLPKFQKSESSVVLEEREINAGPINDGPLTHTDLIFQQSRVKATITPEDEEEKFVTSQ